MGGLFHRRPLAPAAARDARKIGAALHLHQARLGQQRTHRLGLVVAMLVTPGATAYLLTDRFGRMLGIASITGAGCGVLGAYASYFINGSTGGCIVVLQTLVFLIALVFAPKHGLLATRRLRVTSAESAS